MNEITTKEAVAELSQGEIDMDGHIYTLGGNGLRYNVFVTYPIEMAEEVDVLIFHEYCVQCKDFAFDSISACTTENCPLFHYRLGGNPARKVN